MNELEAKVRCLELAAQVLRAQGISDENSIVKISSTFYNHVNTSMESIEPPLKKVSQSAPKGNPKKDNQPEFLR